MRPFMDGPATIILRAKPAVIPIWVEIDWLWGFYLTKKWWFGIPRQIRISVGKEIIFTGEENRREITEIIQSSILTLADDAI